MTGIHGLATQKLFLEKNPYAILVYLKFAGMPVMCYHIIIQKEAVAIFSSLERCSAYSRVATTQGWHVLFWIRIHCQNSGHSLGSHSIGLLVNNAAMNVPLS